MLMKAAIASTASSNGALTVKFTVLVQSAVHSAFVATSLCHRAPHARQPCRAWGSPVRPATDTRTIKEKTERYFIGSLAHDQGSQYHLFATSFMDEFLSSNFRYAALKMFAARIAGTIFRVPLNADDEGTNKSVCDGSMTRPT
jgi:hypothetical protein